MATEMTPYDQRAWAETEKWRERRLTSRGRRLIPEKIRGKVSDFGRALKDKFETLPGSEEFEAVFTRARGRLVDLGSRGAMTTVRDGAILSAYRKRGHDVKSISDIRKVDLKDVDKVKPNLALAYAGTTAAEGAAAGVRS